MGIGGRYGHLLQTSGDASGYSQYSFFTLNPKPNFLVTSLHRAPQEHGLIQNLVRPLPTQDFCLESKCVGCCLNSIVISASQEKALTWTFELDRVWVVRSSLQTLRTRGPLLPGNSCKAPQNCSYQACTSN